jgi:hypothetical protein
MATAHPQTRSVKDAADTYLDLLGELDVALAAERRAADKLFATARAVEAEGERQRRILNG